ISFYLEQEGGGKIGILATKLGISENLITSWLQGRWIPKLSTLLQMCVCLDTTPVCFLTGKEPIATFTNPSHFIRKEFRSIEARKRKMPSDPSNLRKALEAALLSDEKPGRSVTEIALTLGYSSTTVPYQYFPDLCHAISVKRRIAVDSLRKQLEV